MVIADSTDGKHPPRVLVIDDEDYIVDMLMAALEQEGFATDGAYNGRDGLKQALSGNVDLIITDIMMPYLNGIALVERLRADERTRAIPVIMMSAGVHSPSPLPNVTFLPKPFDLDHMLALITSGVKRPDPTR